MGEKRKVSGFISEPGTEDSWTKRMFDQAMEKKALRKIYSKQFELNGVGLCCHEFGRNMNDFANRAARFVKSRGNGDPRIIVVPDEIFGSKQILDFADAVPLGMNEFSFFRLEGDEIVTTLCEGAVFVKESWGPGYSWVKEGDKDEGLQTS